MVDIIVRPKNWDELITPYDMAYISVKKHSFRYYINIIIEKLKGNDISIIEESQIEKS